MNHASLSLRYFDAILYENLYIKYTDMKNECVSQQLSNSLQ